MKIAILIPVFNDWESLEIFLSLLGDHLPSENHQISVIAVNDGSISSYQTQTSNRYKNIQSFEIIDLLTNLGHQRAIAVGLSDIYRREYFDLVVVCDSDGEDKPEDVGRLLYAAVNNQNSIVVSQRVERSESYLFRIFYLSYKLIFKLLTGKSIDFGNFCLLPQSQLARLVYMPELWNHLAATIVKAKMPLVKIPTSRGIRYAGSSKMNLPSLVIHGLGAISVFIDILLVRILIGVGVIGFCAMLIGLITIFIKFATSLAIPGWATIVLGIVCIVFLQSIMLSLISIFMMLSLRSSGSIIPALYSLSFIERLKKIY